MFVLGEGWGGGGGGSSCERNYVITLIDTVHPLIELKKNWPQRQRVL